MKIRKEYIILIGIIVILSLYLLFKNGDRTNYDLPELEQVAKEDVTRMVFSLGGRVTILERSDDLWRIMPQGFKADGPTVDRMLEAVSGFSLNTLAAESGNYGLYDLDDEKRIKLEAYKDEEVILSIDIGKKADTNRHTFVKLQGNDGIYQAGSDLRGVFDIDLARLRDKAAVTIEKDQVTGLTLVTPEGPVEITRGDISALSEAGSDSISAPRAAWLTSNGGEADEQTVNGIISALSRLKCEGYVEGRTKEEMTSEIYMVTVRGMENVTLKIFELEGERYPAISTQNDYPFYLPKWRGEQIMKVPADIMKSVVE